MGTATPVFAFRAPEWVDEAPSTNDVLKQRLASPEPPPSGTVFAARRQTKGKGRLGNVWHSSAEGDLTFSFVWKGDIPLEEAGTLPLACGLAVRDFLSGLGIEAECKWPNDVFVDNAKICGILIEGGTGPGGLSLVTGIGVNVRAQPERDRALGRPTASLEKCLGYAENPETLLSSLLLCLEMRITAWQLGGFAVLRKDMEQALWGRGKGVKARTPAGPIEGIVAGVGDNGELLVRSEKNEIIRIASVAALDDVYAGNRQGNTI